MLLLAALLLAQPDLRSVVVLFITTLAMMFLADAKRCPFLSIIDSGMCAVVLLIMALPYATSDLVLKPVE